MDATAALGHDGRIYVFGGWSPRHGDLRRVQIYDPNANRWSRGRGMPTAREAGAAATGPSGEIYVAGGANSDGGRDAHSLGRVEVYQPATNRWVCVLHIPTRRRFPAAAAAAGRIYVMGGYTASAGFLARVEAYVPPSGGAAC
jgi:kelch-like protein 26